MLHIGGCCTREASHSYGPFCCWISFSLLLPASKKLCNRSLSMSLFPWVERPSSASLSFNSETFRPGLSETRPLAMLDRMRRRRKSSLRSCQYPGHTLDHTGKITSVAGRHVVNFQIASEISQSFGPSRKYHSSFLFMPKSFLTYRDILISLFNILSCDVFGR